jgi:hypothetical protein
LLPWNEVQKMLGHEIALSEWERQGRECVRAALRAHRIQKFEIESPVGVQDSLGARPKEDGGRSRWAREGRQARRRKTKHPKKIQSTPRKPFITKEH